MTTPSAGKTASRTSRTNRTRMRASNGELRICRVRRARVVWLPCVMANVYGMAPGGSSSGCGDFGQGEIERRSFSGGGLHPNNPAVSFDNLFADRQPNARAGVLIARVESLEQHENALEVLRVNADAIVRDRKHPVVGVQAGKLRRRGGASQLAHRPCLDRANLNSRRHIRGTK